MAEFICPDCGRKWAAFVVNPRTYNVKLEDPRCRPCRRRALNLPSHNQETARRGRLNKALLSHLPTPEEG